MPLLPDQLPGHARGGALRATLRQATAPFHDAVERRFDTYDLSRPDDYARFLHGHAAAILPMEAALEAAGIAAWLPDWPQRARAEALRADLGMLDAEHRDGVDADQNDDSLGIVRHA